MEITVYNPQKGRLETIEVEFTKQNTTWFECSKESDVYMITDVKGGLLIREYDYTNPLLIYGKSRRSIKYSKKIANKLKGQYYDSIDDD